VKPANIKAHRRDCRFAGNQSGKRKVVVIVRVRGGNSVPAVFNSESQAASFIRARIAKGTTMHADEAASWDNLHERFEVKRINHARPVDNDGSSLARTALLAAERGVSTVGRRKGLGAVGIAHANIGDVWPV
jgi:hypothetical protein